MCHLCKLIGEGSPGFRYSEIGDCMPRDWMMVTRNGNPAIFYCEGCK